MGQAFVVGGGHSEPTNSKGEGMFVEYDLLVVGYIVGIHDEKVARTVG